MAAAAIETTIAALARAALATLWLAMDCQSEDADVQAPGGQRGTAMTVVIVLVTGPISC